MRVAVISDMHGNDLTFETVENDIQKQKVDQIVFLVADPWAEYAILTAENG